jgi:psiF repeat
MTISSRAAVAAFVSLFLASSAFAQQTTAPAANPDTKSDAAAPADKKMAKPRSAASIECSKEADEKGLKGKDRKKFRAECKKEAAAKPKS